MSSADEQGEIFPTRLKLRRIDPERNMRRFYLMQVQPDLFGGASLIREWGRIGNRGRVLVEHHADEGEAATALLNMARAKGRRGYGS
ncbi:WGR domain-containing protein [uncultured Jannaschia sp.]|uniref:WGR domain-containing protein n=1 Tax=uncultured Jannaschia sp. TaxID=293347 RepID=UPI0026246548|nr:WGR domain-containing protein [uncultured Jannaschia sp.]